MSKGRLKPEDESIVQENYCYLKENLEALDLVDYLYQCRVVTTHEKELIYAEKIKKQRNEVLLNILLNSGAGESFSVFLKSLETQYQSVVQHLLGEGNSIEDGCALNYVDTLLKKQNDTLKAEIDLLKTEINHLKKEKRCLKCRQQDLTMECKEDVGENSFQGNNENENSSELTDGFLEEFVCETTGLSNIKCFEKCRHIIGQHEHQFTENEKIDLQMCKALCKKNPGHVNFIELDKFCVEHLPEYCRDIKMVEYVKAVAGLTVKISVNRTSPYRPQYWSDTQAPYPFYDVRGQSNLRIGSGIITRIACCQTCAFFAHCTCHQCSYSQAASKTWWEIDIETSKNLVFDSVEANHTTVTLFFDQENSSPISFKEVKIVISDRSTYLDECTLRYAVCDKDKRETIRTIVDMLRYYDLAQKQVIDFSQCLIDNKFIFLVSFPHGCSKMVSLGQWKDKYKVEENRNKFTYTACTCPGSVGTKVNIIGYTKIPVHSGCLKSGLNYTSITKIEKTAVQLNNN